MALPAEVGSRHILSASPEAHSADPGDTGILVAFPNVDFHSDFGPTQHCVQENTVSTGLYPYVKYAIDLVAASILFILALPVFALIAIAVASSSPGGAYFRQTRVGKDMQPFQCLKFRTMVPDAETILAQDPELARIHALNWKLDNDPRVTKVGKFLRKTSLDELPQLVNVINGEMSMVGPRPVQAKELDALYGQFAERAFCVRPGVTGLWQVSGRSNLSYSERVALDLEYTRHISLHGDLKVVALTIPAVVLRRGAH